MRARIPFLRPMLPPLDSYRGDFEAIYRNNWYSNSGPYVQRFEQELAATFGVQHAIVVFNATVGLMLAYKALDLVGNVVVPSFTFPATLTALNWCGIPHRLADIDPETLCVTPATITAAADEATVAVCVVNCFGNVADIDGITRLARSRGWKLMFDSAAAIGSRYRGTRIGGFGNVEVFSLHATKVMPVGEGAVITTDDDQLAERIRKLKNFGFAPGSRVSEDPFGINCKMPEMTAAIGLRALDRLQPHIDHRLWAVAEYKTRLGNHLRFQRIAEEVEPSVQILSVLVEEAEQRDELVSRLLSSGIEVRTYFNPVLHRLESYRRADQELPFTSSIADRVVSLPLYSDIDLDTIEQVSTEVLRCLTEIRSSVAEEDLKNRSDEHSHAATAAVV